MIATVLAKTEPAPAETSRRETDKPDEAADGGETTAAPKTVKNRASVLKRALGGKNE
jgi:hypothetical protein